MKFFAVLFLLAAGAASLHADEALFIGNSYTYGGSVAPVKSNGGVPKLVELIAASKGKKLAVKTVAVGGKDWGFHLQRTETYDALKERPWTWIVLQDYSTKSTHIGNAEEFFQNGGIFYQKAKEATPQAKIMLYQTWAREKTNPMYTGTSSPKSFTNSAEMFSEIKASYAELQKRLEALDPGPQIALAPVGEAFALCAEKHPEISLYVKDKHHASEQGSYLAALVLYASLFQDNPVGATREFPGFTVPADVAAHLQEVARLATAP